MAYNYMGYFADEVIMFIMKDFRDLHLSGNLTNTLTVEREGLNKVTIRIPAQIYDMYKYLKEKVIIYTGQGSYASRLNDEGSYIFKKYIGNHIRYIDSSISLAMMNLENKIKADNLEYKVELK